MQDIEAGKTKFLLILIALPFLIFFAVIIFANGTQSLKNNDLGASAIKVAKKDINSQAHNIYFEKVDNIPFPARDSHTAYIFNNILFITGGLNAQNQVIDKAKGYVAYENAEYFNDIWASQDGINWRLVKERAEFPPIRSASIVNFKEKLFLLGGWSPKVGYNIGIWQSEDGIAWKKIKNNPEFGRREGQQVIEFKGKLFLIGGVNYNYGGQKVVFNDIWESEDGLNWKLVVRNAAFSPRWDFGVVVFKDKIYLAGGMSGIGQTFGDVWMSEDGKKWKLLTAVAPFKKRQGQILVNYKDRIYLIGGISHNLKVSNVWFTEDGINWQKPLIKQSIPQIEDHSVVIFKGKILSIGGMTGNLEWINNVWISKFYSGEEIRNILKNNPEKINLTAEAFGALKCKEEKCSYLVKFHEKRKLPIASLTKLITSIVGSQEYKPSSVLEIPSEAKLYTSTTTPGVDGIIKEKDKFYFSDLLKLALIPSSNKAAFAIAENYGYEKFIEKMRSKTQELNMKDTFLYNPVGLDIKKQINLSNVDDLVKLITYIKNELPGILKITQIKEGKVKNIKGKEYFFKNVNEVLFIPNIANNIAGGKTGTTPLAKENLILLTKDNYLYIILKSDDRVSDLITLINLVKTI